jgi:peptidase E
MGGCPLEALPESLRLHRYVLALAEKDRPKVCFVPTAGGESPPHIVTYYATFTPLNTVPSHLSLFSPPTADLRSYLLDHDVIYVGGGNTKSMLALWREWGLDAILREAWQAGKVLAGSSAGSICWFEAGITDSIPGPLTPLPCLGYLAGSNCPHYDSEEQRRPTYQRLVAQGRIPPGYASEDYVGLHYTGTQLVRIVTGRPGGRAYRVERDGDTAAETPIAAELLG